MVEGGERTWRGTRLSPERRASSSRLTPAGVCGCFQSSPDPGFELEGMGFRVWG